MLTNIFDFFLIIGAIQGFVFVIIPLFLKKKIETPVWLLSGIVLSISLNNLHAWFIAKHYSFQFKIFENLIIPWYMMATPFFFAFIIHYLNIQQKIKDLLKLFSFLFLIQICIRLYIITFLHEQNPSIIKTYNNFEEILNVIISIYLFSKAAHIVFKRKHLYIDVLVYDDIHWIKQFIILGFFIILFWVMAVLANNYLPFGSNHIIYYYPLRLGSSFLMYWIGYQGLIHYNLLQDRISLRKEINKNDSLSALKNKGDEEWGEKQYGVFLHIEKYLLDHKRYLDSTLSLSLLAKEQNISMSYLSKLINTFGKSNFSDYINELRVNRAMILLSDTNYHNYTIVSIGLECGFNSKSTFYNAFKKFAGKTPSAYKASYRKD